MPYAQLAASEHTCTPGSPCAPPNPARHDAGTYSVEAAKQLPFPRAGGATGSIRFKPEMSHGASEWQGVLVLADRIDVCCAVQCTCRFC